MTNPPLLTAVDGLFDRWPALLGFSVQDACSLSSDREWVRLDEGLVLADVGLDDWLAHDEKMELLAEVTHALLELLDERAEAPEALRGRTFARALH